ncbi:hypothetical protein J2S40_003968 [Nocardioides luteus]|nr:hypothetical protein [Nocardioides luteus]MDR7312910.1 hypothetical protein [Nocardioides luteus]
MRPTPTSRCPSSTRSTSPRSPRPLELVELTPEQARRQMSEFMPPEVVDGTLDILGRPTDHEQAASPDVEAVLGKPARGFGEWVERFAAAYGG